MAFAMKEGGGVSSAINVFFNSFLLKTIYNHFPTAKTRFAHSLSFKLCIYSN